MSEIEGLDLHWLTVFGDGPVHPLMSVPHSGGEVVINAGREKPLCTLRYVDGRWTAEYRPEDLDEAAQVFLDAVRLLERNAPPLAGATTRVELGVEQTLTEDGSRVVCPVVTREFGEWRVAAGVADPVLKWRRVITGPWQDGAP